MGVFSVVAFISAIIVLVFCGDVDGERIILHRDYSENGLRRPFSPSDEGNRFLGRRIHQGPNRDRRPGGLSYETMDGRDMEHRGKLLERRQLRYAKRLGKMTSKFSEKLIRQIFEKGTTQGLVLSPIGIHMALSVASAGAKDISLKEFTKVLGLRRSRLGKGSDNIHKAYFTLRNYVFNNKQGLNVIDALGVFVKPRTPIEMTFRQTLSQFYNGNVGILSPTPVKDINTWASRQTKGELTSLIPRKAVRPKAEMILTSALCVKGHWKTPFNPVKGVFATGSGTKKTTDMMEQVTLVRTIEIPLLRLTRLQVVLSKVKDKGDIVLDIVPLNCTATIQDAVGVLTNKTLQRDLQRKMAEPMNLVLPKFSVQNGVSDKHFKGVLRKMRLRKSFRKRKANFQGISSTAGLYLQKVFHQSAIQFNEFGIGCSSPTSAQPRSGTGTPKLHNFPPEISPFLLTSNPTSDHRQTLSKIGRERLPTVKVDRLFVFAVREMDYGTYFTAGIFTGDGGTGRTSGYPVDKPLLSDAC